MKVVFKIIRAGSGNDVYFERLSNLLKSVNIDSEIVYYNKLFQFFPFLLIFFNKKGLGDIIHSNVEYGWVFKEKGKPLVVTLHHCVFDKNYEKYISIFQKIYYHVILKPNTHISLNKADKIISVSNYTKESFTNYFGDKKIEVIYNYIDTKKYKPFPVLTTDSRFKLLYVGNLTKRKGVDLLPKIMAELGRKYVLAYTTGLRSKIPKEFNKDNMIPLGKLAEDQLIREYNKCDVLLFPTRLEGFGLSVAEAMSCGKSVIATNNSSIPELIKDKENGFLCMNDDVEDFINKIKFLFKNPKIRKKYQINNRIKAESMFSIKIIRSYKMLYEKLI